MSCLRYRCMKRAEFQMTETIHAPLEAVFERLLQHERMAAWPGVTSCKLICHGEAGNGLGAIRRIKSGPFVIDEQVVQYDPPRGYQYTIVKGLPVDHLGTVRLRQEGEVVRIDWHISISSRVPFLTRAVVFALRMGLPRAVTYFCRDAERALRAL